jgi:hypothetical protein
MSTRVVNIKHQRYDVYIGRAGNGESGYFGNPIRVRMRCSRCGLYHQMGGDTLDCYKAYFEERIAHDLEFRDRVLALRGKVLGCFCKPAPCHGDIILAWLDKQSDAERTAIMTEQNFQIDPSGTVALSGHEELALNFDLKTAYLASLEADVNELKAQLRAVARSVAATAAGAKRIFFRNGKKGGVAVTMPDYTAAGNRLVLSDKKMTDLLKTGDLTTLGVPPEALMEETVEEVGGDAVILRGELYKWWMEKMAAYNAHPDVQIERREKKVSRRLKAEAIGMLTSMAASGSTLAAMLLSLGAKEPSVKAER